MKNLKVPYKLYGGFAVIFFLLAAAVLTTIWQASEIKQTTDRIVTLTTPTAQARAVMTNNINASLAAAAETGKPGIQLPQAAGERDAYYQPPV